MKKNVRHHKAWAAGILAVKLCDMKTKNQWKCWFVGTIILTAVNAWNSDDTHSVRELRPKNGTVEDVIVNLGKHRNSALLLRFNAYTSELKTPTSFTITARAPPVSGYFLSAVVEQIKLRTSTGHNLHETQHTSLCIDYRAQDGRQDSKTGGIPACIDCIKVLSQSLPKSEICGSWLLHRNDPIEHYGIHQTVIGNCQRSGGNVEECHPPTQLNLQVAIGPTPPGVNQSLFFVISVTAFTHARIPAQEYDGKQSCSKDEFLCKDRSAPRCIWNRLTCDNHFNCGLHNDDELDCNGNPDQRFDMYPRQLSAIDIALYSLVLFAMVAAFGVLFYWQKQIKKLLGIEIHALPVPTSEDATGARFLNSVGTLDSGLNNMGRPTTTAISLLFLPRPAEAINPDVIPKNDLPPSYSSLFPDGPPPAVQCSPVSEACYPYEDVAGAAATGNQESSQVVSV